jgi:hypothetical protein
MSKNDKIFLDDNILDLEAEKEELSSSFDPWLNPIHHYIEIEPLTNEFLIRLTATILDWERMARTGLLPEREKARQAAFAVFDYLIEIKKISPITKARIAERWRTEDLAENEDVSERIDTHQENADRKSSVPTTPTFS